MKKNKKILIISIIIIFIIMIIGIYILTNNSKTPVMITHVNYQFDNRDNPVIQFDITNKSLDNDLENGIVYIEFYNKKEKVYTSLYKLNKLNKDSTLTIEMVSNFPYEKLTNYIIKYDKYVVYKSKIK